MSVKVQAAKAAGDDCRCDLIFNIKDAEDISTGSCSQSITFYVFDYINATFANISKDIAEKLIATCKGTGLTQKHTPDSTAAETVVTESAAGAKLCSDAQSEIEGESFTLTCGKVPQAVTGPAIPDKTAATGKSAQVLLGDAAASLNKAGFKSPADVIGRAIKILLAFIGSISLVLYIYAGLLWMTASGASERVDMAKKILVWTTLGVVVMLSSYMLASFVFKSLGL